MKIFENENSRVHLVDDLVQRDQRILGRRIAVLLRLDRRASGNDARAVAPLENLLLPPLRDGNHQLLDSSLFRRHDIKDRITGANQCLQLLGEVHGMSGLGGSLMVVSPLPGRALELIRSSAGFNSLNRAANAGVRLCTRTVPSGRISNSLVEGVLSETGNGFGTPTGKEVVGQSFI